MDARVNRKGILMADCLRLLRRRLLACGLLLCLVALCCHAENQAAIREFGIEKSKPVDGAFLFWKYKYVEAPYLIERRGLGTFVNGILVRPGPAWPRKDPTVKDDPGDPPAGSSPTQDGKNNDYYFWRKWRYLSGKYDLGEAHRLMVEVYRKSSAVSEVRWDGGDAVYVKDKEGKEVPLLLNTWWKDAILTREQVLERATHSVKDLEKRLSLRGSFLWMSGRGGEMGMPSPDALKVLGVMFSDGDLAVKTRELEKEGVLIEPEMAKLVTECPHSEQLAKRYERLKKGEVEEEPAEPPAPVGDVQPLQATHSKALTYAWLGGAFAFAALVASVLLWRLRRR